MSIILLIFSRYHTNSSSIIYFYAGFSESSLHRIEKEGKNEELDRIRAVFLSRQRKNLKAIIIRAVMAWYNKHNYETRIEKGGGHSWVYRSFVGLSRYFIPSQNPSFQDLQSNVDILP